MRIKQHNWLRLRPSKRRWAPCYYLRYARIKTAIDRLNLRYDTRVD